MVNNVSFESRGYFTDEDVVLDVFLSIKTVCEHVVDSEKVINKVHSILNSLNIPISRYYFKLTDLRDTISNFSKSLKQTRIRNSNLVDSLSRIKFRNEERRIKIEAFKTKLVTSQDDTIVLKGIIDPC